MNPTNQEIFVEYLALCGTLVTGFAAFVVIFLACQELAKCINKKLV